jgi:hypothetical protein
VASIDLDDSDFKTHLEQRRAIGRACLPDECPFCGNPRLWLDGVRVVYSLVLVEGTVRRFDDGLELQRAVCAACHKSWTLYPEPLYPHRSFEPDVVEAAGLEYLSEASATYAHVAAKHGCSPRSVWRWIGWLASLLACVRSSLTTAPSRLPHSVPQDHAKARSSLREQLLLSALEALSVLKTWARVGQPAGVRPLCNWLDDQLRTRGELHLQSAAGQSPPLPEACSATISSPR